MSSGSVISTANVPARMMPALVITGPVATSARSTPSRPVLARLLAHAVHQEDVVVDPQSHQEDEREHRQAGSTAGLVEDLRRRRRARRRASRRTRRSPRRSGTAAPRSRAAARSAWGITSSTSGTTFLVSRLRAVAVVGHSRADRRRSRAPPVRRPALSASRISSVRSSAALPYGSSGKVTMNVAGPSSDWPVGWVTVPMPAPPARPPEPRATSSSGSGRPGSTITVLGYERARREAASGCRSRACPRSTRGTGRRRSRPRCTVSFPRAQIDEHRPRRHEREQRPPRATPTAPSPRARRDVGLSARRRWPAGASGSGRSSGRAALLVRTYPTTAGRSTRRASPAAGSGDAISPITMPTALTGPKTRRAGGRRRAARAAPATTMPAGRDRRRRRGDAALPIAVVLVLVGAQLDE